jgi:hypothetical protein
MVDSKSHTLLLSLYESKQSSLCTSACFLTIARKAMSRGFVIQTKAGIGASVKTINCFSLSSAIQTPLSP